MRKYILITIFFLGMVPTLSFAYTETTDGGELIATVDPVAPSSFSNVDITIKSFEIDLDRSQVVWSVNGKEVKGGLGLKKLSVKTGSVGTIVTVGITATDQNEQTIVKTIEINPADVDLLWEADSYVPVFYKGAALPSPGSKVRVYAVPNMKDTEGRINPSSVVYKWRVNYQNVSSGDKKNAVDLTLADITQTKITVDASNLSGQITATKTLTLGPTAPKNIFYEVDSLLGPIYNLAISGTFNMSAKESVIRAEPYYMSNKGEKTYDWKVNGAPFTPLGGDIGTITLRQGGGEAGESSLGVTVKNETNQSVFGSLLVKFGQNIFNF